MTNQAPKTNYPTLPRRLKPSKPIKPLPNSQKIETGGQDENSKVLERTRVKELGKFAP